MNASRWMNGELVAARLRVASVAIMLGLLVPICGEGYWRDEYRYAAAPGVSRLIEAIMELDIAEARHLLSRRSMDLDALDAWGTTPLSHAIAADARLGGSDFVRLLIDQGVDVNQPDRWGHTPLMWSVSSGSASVSELLLREGANVHARRLDGSTVLHIAAQCEAPVAVTRILLDAGVDPTVRDGEGKTPADYAREANLAQLAQLLDGPVSAPALVVR